MLRAPGSARRRVRRARPTRRPVGPVGRVGTSRAGRAARLRDLALGPLAHLRQPERQRELAHAPRVARLLRHLLVPPVDFGLAARDERFDDGRRRVDHRQTCAERRVHEHVHGASEMRGRSGPGVPFPLSPFSDERRSAEVSSWFMQRLRPAPGPAARPRDGPPSLRRCARRVTTWAMTQPPSGEQRRPTPPSRRTGHRASCRCVASTDPCSTVRSNSSVWACSRPLASMSAEMPEIAACTTGRPVSAARIWPIATCCAEFAERRYERLFVDTTITSAPSRTSGRIW